MKEGLYYKDRRTGEILKCVYRRLKAAVIICMIAATFIDFKYILNSH